MRPPPNGVTSKRGESARAAPPASPSNTTRDTALHRTERGNVDRVIRPPWPFTGPGHSSGPASGVFHRRRSARALLHSTHSARVAEGSMTDLQNTRRELHRELPDV